MLFRTINHLNATYIQHFRRSPVLPRRNKIQGEIKFINAQFSIWFIFFLSSYNYLLSSFRFAVPTFHCSWCTSLYVWKRPPELKYPERSRNEKTCGGGGAGGEKIPDRNWNRQNLFWLAPGVKEESVDEQSNFSKKHWMTAWPEEKQCKVHKLHQKYILNVHTSS